MIHKNVPSYVLVNIIFTQKHILDYTRTCVRLVLHISTSTYFVTEKCRARDSVYVCVCIFYIFKKNICIIYMISYV